MLEAIKKYIPVFDWALSIGTIGYGIYTDTWWIILLGTGGMGIALLNPSKRVESAIKNKLTKKANKLEHENIEQQGIAAPLADKPKVSPALQYYLDNPQLIPRNILDMTPVLYKTPPKFPIY